ncbi:MAG: hypothetical protein Q8K98_08015 [Bacteroidota bacterium]|nr:hypothetical protein [Bacteroidota bacterium]
MIKTLVDETKNTHKSVSNSGKSYIIRISINAHFNLSSIKFIVS